MAKMFYTMDETKTALGKTEDEIKQLTREGKLREFRDGPRLMFKADQVEGLKSDTAAAIGSTIDQVGLSGGDTSTPLGLMDSKSGTGTGTAMAMNVDSAAPKSDDDTATGMDVGLSGSLSGSIGGGSLAGNSLTGSLGGTAGGSLGGSATGAGASRTPGKQGVNVFGSDEVEQADPMAQTHITPPKEQISLEGVGSGSGLLDLTRETDDTSLGAALLDEISPGGKRVSPTPGAVAPGSSSGSTAGMTSISPMELPPEPMAAEPAPVSFGTPVYVEAPDSTAPAFAAASLGATVMILVGAAVLINSIHNDNPLVDARFGLVQWVAEKGPIMVLVIGFLVVFLPFFAGLIVGKMNRARASA